MVWYVRSGTFNEDGLSNRLNPKLSLLRRLVFFSAKSLAHRLLIIIELAGAQGGRSLSSDNGWEINSGVNFSQ